MLTDTHCHLDKIGDFNTIKTELVKTKNVGIENIIIPTINEQNFNDVLHLNKLNELNKLNKLNIFHEISKNIFKISWKLLLSYFLPFTFYLIFLLSL